MISAIQIFLAIMRKKKQAQKVELEQSVSFLEKIYFHIFFLSKWKRTLDQGVSTDLYGLYLLIFKHKTSVQTPGMKTLVLDQKLPEEMQERQRSQPVPLTPLRPRQTRISSAYSEGLNHC